MVLKGSNVEKNGKNSKKQNILFSFVLKKMFRFISKVRKISKLYILNKIR